MIDSLPESPTPLTFRMRLRDWLGTKAPRHLFSRLPGIHCRLPGADRELALTFDDGPHPVGTPRLLEVLQRQQATATFFLIGERARRWPELVREILAAGHAIGNHSWSHIDCWKSPRTRILREFSACQHELEAQSGSAVQWVRPPFGHFNPSLRGWARRRQCRIVLWDVIPPDYSPVANLSRLEEICRPHLRAGSIICLHDNDNSLRVTPQFLERLIPECLAAGYRFGSLRT